ncbi:MAG TPA: fatty acid--CoA ligase family protein [Bacteroidota bacterium]|nr:fatty acid--CoA ligase family protein [Bacteroidota bacterium]
MSLERFYDAFISYGSRVANISGNRECSYDELISKIGRATEYLRGARIKPGEVVVLESEFHAHGIAYLLALISANTIIVPVSSGGRSLADEKIKLSGASKLISVSCDGVVETSDLEYRYNHTYYDVLRKKSVPGLILFTSGTSGVPKAAVHDLSKLMNRYSIKDKNIRTINFLLFDHWGGLNTLFNILSSGGCVVSLTERSPDEVCRIIEKYRVQMLPTSPTFLNLLLLSEAYQRYDLSSLSMVTYGTEPMPETTLKKLVQVFPDVRFKQTYGLIEVGVLQSSTNRNDTTWLKIGGEGYDVRIVDNILQIKSETAMLGYLNAESPFTRDGYFITGDYVLRDGDYIKILGRRSEIINVGGEKVYPIEVESVIRCIDNVKDVVVYAESHHITGQIVCAKLNLLHNEEKESAVRRIKAEARTMLDRFKVPVKIHIVEDALYGERFKISRDNISKKHE